MDETLLAAIKSGQWYLIAPAVVVLALRILQRDWLQALIPAKYRWAQMRLWLRQTIVFVTSLFAATIAAVLAGQGLLAALLASLPVAVAAISAHKISQAVGHQMTANAIAKDPFYMPGITRKALDIVVPLDNGLLGGNADLKPKT